VAVSNRLGLHDQVRIIPEGVQIRPFADGNGTTPNTWYYADFSDVLRIIGNPPV
jgi:hypothetical protein